jgi:hypothetical protein
LRALCWFLEQTVLDDGVLGYEWTKRAQAELVIISSYSVFNLQI